jgi:hypothetical protein
MSIFDESIVEAGHQRLASTISAEIEALVASTDLIRKALLHQDRPRNDPDCHADYLAASSLGFRIVNNVGAASRLLDCGYFVQAAALFRDIAEIGMLVLAFSATPDSLRDWRNSVEKRYRTFGRTKLREMAADRVKFNFLDQYFNAYSEYGAHPSSISIIAHHDGLQFQIGPHVNAELYRKSYRELAVLTWHVTDAAGDAYKSIFKSDLSQTFPDEAQRFAHAWNSIAPTISPSVGEKAISAS